ncbi:MAG: transposase [Acidobacteriaceae bacterium]
MAVLAGASWKDPLAGKGTLNRLEISRAAASVLTRSTTSRRRSHAQEPEQIVLDLDAADRPLRGHQPERFFHGYYDSYCYLPLYIFADDQLLCARLRPANVDGAAGALDEVKRIVAQLRSRWPKVSVGSCRAPGPEQEERIQRLICEKRPEQPKLAFALWTRSAIMLLIERV